jgi:hypothetical protein
MMFDPFGGAGVMFAIIPVFVTIGFFTVFGLVIYRLVQGARQYKRNNDSPVLTVEAKVVTKRSDVSHYHHQNMTNNTMDTAYSTTYYYVTFEVESGDRMEFHVENHEYGLLAEGDRGKLTFQGTRYLGFSRCLLP